MSIGRKRIATVVMFVMTLLTLVMVKPNLVHAKTVATTTSIGKAKKVKTGTTTVKVKKGKKVGYVKFVAPKTKTYKFTVSGIQTNDFTEGHDINYGHFEIMRKTYGTTSDLLIRTKGGKAYSCPVCTQYSYDTAEDKSKVDVYSPLPSRTAAVKLQKGQTVWIAYYITARGVSTYKLKIK